MGDVGVCVCVWWVGWQLLHLWASVLSLSASLLLLSFLVLSTDSPVMIMPVLPISWTLWPSGQGVGLLSRWGLPAWVRIPQVSFGLPFVVRGTHVCSDSPLLLQGHSPNAPVVVCCRTAARCVPGGRTLLAFGAARSWKHFKTLWPSG